MAKKVEYDLTYRVLEYAGKKYFPVGTYDNPDDAEHHRKILGYRSKVKIIKKRKN